MADEILLVDATAPSAAILDEACSKCGRVLGDTVKRSPSMPSYCIECAKSVRHETTLAKNDNTNWITLAMEQGIPLWEQQPGETVDEYELWTMYRDLWPDVRPTVTKVSDAAGVTVHVVQRAFNRWTWAARLQAWIREVNADRTAELRRSRRQMVEDHIELGAKMREKMKIAVDELDPEDVTPSELVSLLKETQRLEESAREAYGVIEAEVANDIDNMPAGLFEDGPADDAPLGGMSPEDAAEVVNILAQAGVLQIEGGRVGLRKTTTETTEIVMEEF